jgi:AcrR family transcriptional regulator
MTRNKYPEQTVASILAVAERLFIEQGYEKTSIQDILAQVNFSKGAVYHHFPSKESILDAVMERHMARTAQMLEELILTVQAESARAKVTAILEEITTSDEASALDHLLVAQLKNPQFTVLSIRKGTQTAAPLLADVLRTGQQDGSITTEYPRECVEVLLLLVNIWLSPVLFDRSATETATRLTFLQEMMRRMGADVISDSLVANILRRHSKIRAGLAE